MINSININYQPESIQNLLDGFEIPIELEMDASVLDQLMEQDDEFKDFIDFQIYQTNATL